MSEDEDPLDSQCHNDGRGHGDLTSTPFQE